MTGGPVDKRILIFGGRNYGVMTDDTGRFICYDALAAMAILTRLSSLGAGVGDTVVSGGATGADHLGEMIGEAIDMTIERHEALWDKYGRSAGPLRNREMLASGIDYAIKCPGGRGTKHMTGLLQEAGVPIYEV